MPKRRRPECEIGKRLSKCRKNDEGESSATVECQLYQLCTDTCVRSSNKDESTAEQTRLAGKDEAEWRQWGPYLSERQWGTVREDQSEDGRCWEDFTHDEAFFRAYLSGDDGLLGICDDQGQLCMALALWNGIDTVLKERMFGLSSPQGNHAEDVKDQYFYLDSTPSHSYMRALYKYPQVQFPYEKLVLENAARTRNDPEFEILDTGIFDQQCYWDVFVEYAKSNPHDILCRYTVHNRAPKVATIYLLPTLWHSRNTKSEQSGDCVVNKPTMKLIDNNSKVLCTGIDSLGDYIFVVDSCSPEILMTNNETNELKIKPKSKDAIVETNKTTKNNFKDAFHEYLINGDQSAVQQKNRLCCFVFQCSGNQSANQKKGTKCAAVFCLKVRSGSVAQVRCRLYRQDCTPNRPFGRTFDNIMSQRMKEADTFYNMVIPDNLTDEEKSIVRQAYSGLCWTKQFYYYHKPLTKKGDRNSEWKHVLISDVISMPDKWEFPWFALWDLAFQMIPFSDIDLSFAKSQMLLFLSDKCQHPDGQLPGCEFNFDDMNPPLHAWACLHIYRKGGSLDFAFLKKTFHKLVINFTWWLKQKVSSDKLLFSCGFLGMDNISCIDRSLPPEGIKVEQADATSWMVFYARCMMEMALELSKTEVEYEHLAITYLQHFVAIAEAINNSDKGLWHAKDEFFYDRLNMVKDGSNQFLQIRSLVGLLCLVPVVLLKSNDYEHLSKFNAALQIALSKLDKVCAKNKSPAEGDSQMVKGDKCLLSLISLEQLKSVLRYLFDEEEFLAPFGIRSLSKVYGSAEYSFKILDETYSISYCPGDSNSAIYGGNSNWRGPVWLCMNYLLLEALDVYGAYFDEALNVEFPTGSEQSLPLHKAISEIRCRIIKMFLPDGNGLRPLHGKNEIFAKDPNWKSLVLFHEFFNGDTGQGHGASHQTGWTALIASIIRDQAKSTK